MYLIYRAPIVTLCVVIVTATSLVWSLLFLGSGGHGGGGGGGGSVSPLPSSSSPLPDIAIGGVPVG